MNSAYDHKGILINRRRNNRNLVPNLVTQVTRPDTITSGQTKASSVIEFIASTVGSTQLVVNVGDDIQTAINNLNSIGGGIVYLRQGTHVQNSDIILYSNVTMQGETALGTIIDFGGQAHSLKIWGNQLHSTGTIAVSAGGTTVTGSGTAWTSALNGAEIILQGVYYTITAVGSGTSLTINAPYLGIAISGGVYSIDSPIYDVQVQNLTVQNSSGNNIDVRNADIVLFNKVASLYGGYGMYANFVDAFIIDDAEIIGCGYGINANNCSPSFQICYISYTTVGYGINLNGANTGTMLDWSAEGCVGNGVSLTNCLQLDFFSGDTNTNGGKGIEMISNNMQITISGHSSYSNVSDGIKLTASSSYNCLESSQYTNNGGWGINVAVVGDTGNVLNGNVYYGNTSGNYNNAGTSTRIF